MKELAGFSPKATRDGKKIEEKFRLRQFKALEKFQIDEEVLATKKAKIRSKRRSVTDFSGAMGMYIIDTDEGRKVTTTVSAASLPFPNVKENVMVMIIKFIKSIYNDPKCELNWKEFMAIAICLQVPVPYIIRQVNMITLWGAIPTLALHLLLNGCIAMPIYMVLMFLGNYSRKSYIKFWECVPILKGLAYSIMLGCTQHEIYNITLASLSLSYIWNVLSSSDYPWKNCNFKKHSSTCYFHPPVIYNASCCYRGEPECTDEAWSTTIFKYAPYDYFIRNQLQFDYMDFENVRKPMPLIYMGYAAFIWLLVFSMLMIGLKKFRKVLTTINIIIAAIFFGPILAFTLNYGDQLMFPGLMANYTVFFNYTFLMAVTRHSLHRELAGEVITYSAQSSPGISTGVDTLCIYTLKLLAILMITAWVSMGASMVQKYYRIRDSKCIDLNGFTFTFAIIPDMITRLHFPKLLILMYFLMLFLWTFCGSVYSLYSFVGAVMEEYPKLMKFKGLVCGTICVISCTANILILQGNLLKIYTIWLNETYIQMKVVLVFFTLIGIFLYSLNRLSDDYHFTYGQKLHRFWIYGLKIAMLLITISSLIYFVIKFGSTSISLLDGIVISLTVVPVACGAIIIFARYKGGLRKTFKNPDPQWGPADYNERIARSKFDPKSALRYKTTAETCKHSCLLRSKLLRKEIGYWESQYLERHGVEID